MSKPISRFSIPDIKDIAPDLQEKIMVIQEKMGFVPNVFLAMAGRPEECRGFFMQHDALMDKNTGLTKGEREMIVVATSGINQCLYCVTSHGAILRIREKNPIIADQLASNYRKADITPKQRLMLDFAVKVSLRSHEVEDADLDLLRENGFSDDDIWDIGAISALFAMSNRIANMANILPNKEFYGMAR